MREGKGGVFREKRGDFRGFVGKIRGFCRKNKGGGGFFVLKNEVFVENGGFTGKIVGFLKNEVFVGFWSRNWEKLGKSREFDDFWKIGENREK